VAIKLPYFKFFCSEWNDGDITLEDFETQGVFINICSLYWSRECKLSRKVLERRFPNNLKNILTLKEEGILVIDSDDLVIIRFLDRQAKQKDGRSSTSATNGSKGGRPKKPNKPNLEPIEKPVEPNPEPNSTQLREDKEKIRQREDNKNILKNEFDKFRKLYKGTKNGLDSEFENFKKKYKNLEAIIPLLIPSIIHQEKARKALSNANQFCPPWKNLSTWINNQGWDIEIAKPEQSGRPQQTKQYRV